MNNYKRYVSGFLAPFFAIVLIGILLSYFLYYLINWVLGYDVLLEPSYEKRLDGLVKILGLSISITGFISIVITIIQSRESLQRDIRQSSVDLFKELRNESFINARRRAWLVKEKWYNDKEYKQKLIAYNFSNRGKNDIEEFNNDIRVVYQLLEFYLLVSVYEGNESNLKALRYFYYGWWRHFLYDFAIEIETNSRVNYSVDYRTSYFKDISYIATLKRLDKLCSLEKIPHHTMLHFDGG